MYVKHWRVERLPIPERLYGRDVELERLTASFDRLARKREVVAISGEPGAGKTALVAELLRLRPRAFFALGKCDERSADSPLLPVRQALGELARAVLETSPEERARLRTELEGAASLIDLVPELARVIGRRST